ncbi:MAG: GMC family oxidoreductase [Spirochaetales bacterium]|nr:GMC family oxidoreductase [Spirochaetales bacterium]
MNANLNWNPDKIYDYLIIGSGMGGSAVVSALAESGSSILMVERGDFIRQEKENWSVPELALNRRYAAEEKWLDSRGNEFTPRMYYNVGGNSKFFGGSAFRLREKDFDSQWPLDYSEMAPWYKKAEEILGVRGKQGEDPTEPSDQSYPLPPIPHEQAVRDLSRKLTKQGLHPFHLPIAVDQGPEGRCRKGSPCDGFPCMVRAKGDAENRMLRPLLLKESSPLTFLTNTRALRLLAGPDNTITGAVLFRNGKEYIQKARRVILSAGAVNSAALLLNSADTDMPEGLANSSGYVGRCYMAHTNTVLLALSLFRKNPTVFQKTLAVNDFYNQGWGNIQLRGKVKKEMLQNKKQLAFRLFPDFIAQRSMDLWLMSEDSPNPENRVTFENGRIRINLNPTENRGHEKLIRAARKMMRKAGYPLLFTDRRGIEAVQHQCGTLRMGGNSDNSVLNKWCRSWDHPNLYVVDASFFPASAAVNPALTIAAMGLRVGTYLKNLPHKGDLC